MSTLVEGAQLNHQDVANFARSFRGRLVRPGDGDYDSARRLWNGSIDRYPALIAQCAGVADVIDAVKLDGRRASPSLCAAAGIAFRGCRRVMVASSSTCR
jgi:hypothetical protein